MSEIFYLEADHFDTFTSEGGDATEMLPKTIFVTKTDGSSFMSDGDQVYLWNYDGLWGTDPAVPPDVQAIQDGTVDELPIPPATMTYRGQVELLDGTFAPWFEQKVTVNVGFREYVEATRYVVLHPEGKPVSEVDISFWKSVNPFADFRGWDNYNNNGWELTDTLGGSETADIAPGALLMDLGIDPAPFEEPQAEPGDVRHVPPAPDDTPVAAIQGTTAYGRDDADPATVEEITFAFGPAGVPYTLGDVTVETSEWTETQREAYRAAHAVYEDVANVRFVEVDDVTDAELDEYVADFSGTPLADVFGEQDFPALSSSLGVLNTHYMDMADGAAAQPGGFFFSTVLHEQGHGLGLGHPHDTSGGTTVMRGVTAPTDLGEDDLNQGVFTVMSYNHGYPEMFGESYGEFGELIGLGALDIAAIQAMYGANTDTRTGDDVYRLDAENAPGAGFMAIWDAGGTDTMRHDGPRAARIDLRPATLEYDEGGAGYMSLVEKVKAGRTIASGVTIENAVGGAAADAIMGNDAANLLVGRGGNDQMLGGDGDDRLLAGPGDDVAAGSLGDDVLRGRAGEDTLAGGSGEDRLLGDAGDDLLFGGADSDTLLGGAGADSLEGGAGADLLRGGAGNDALFGGAGRNALVGGAGEDAFIVDAAAGVAVVRDFAPEADALVFAVEGADSLDDLTMRERDRGLVVGTGEGKAFLVGVTADALDEDNVIFIGPEDTALLLNG